MKKFTFVLFLFFLTSCTSVDQPNPPVQIDEHCICTKDINQMCDPETEAVLVVPSTCTCDEDVDSLKEKGWERCWELKREAYPPSESQPPSEPCVCTEDINEMCDPDTKATLEVPSSCSCGLNCECEGDVNDLESKGWVRCEEQTQPPKCTCTTDEVSMCNLETDEHKSVPSGCSCEGEDIGLEDVKSLESQGWVRCPSIG